MEKGLSVMATGFEARKRGANALKGGHFRNVGEENGQGKGGQKKKRKLKKTKWENGRKMGAGKTTNLEDTLSRIGGSQTLDPEGKRVEAMGKGGQLTKKKIQKGVEMAGKTEHLLRERWRGTLRNRNSKKEAHERCKKGLGSSGSGQNRPGIKAGREANNIVIGSPAKKRRTKES